MGLFRSYLRTLKPYTKDDRRRDFQKQQWRRRVDAQMRGASLSTGRTVPCPNCSTAITFPAPGRWSCKKCGYNMDVTFGKNATTMREAGPDTPSDPKAGNRAVSTASQLERLAKLHRSGELTDDEFAAAKARVIRT